MRTFSRTLLVLGCLTFPSRALAQLPPNSSTTSTPVAGAGHDYLGGVNETVNPMNGSVSIRIPVIMPPSRGITLPFSFAYDSNGVNWLQPPSGTSGNGFWSTMATVTSQGGWSNTAPVVTVLELHWTTIPEGGAKPVNCYALINFQFQDARGNRHNLDLTNTSFASNPNGACATDTWDWPGAFFTGAVVTQGGEGPTLATIPTNWNISPRVTITDGDGTVLSFPGVNGFGVLPTSVTDRDGNTMNITSGSTVSYTDTTGRTALQDSGFAVSPETVTVSGLGASYTLNWTALSTPTFSTPITTEQGSCGIGHFNWLSTKGVSSLTLPNGRSFSFTYDPVYGLVNKVTYPSGGYVRYVYGMNAQAEIASNNPYCTMLYGVPAVTDRYVSFDGSNEVLHQTFTYSTTWNWPNSLNWVSKQTTVTTYDLVRNTSFQTVYTYASTLSDYPPNSPGPPTYQDPVESSIAYYDTNGSLLKTVTKGWQNPRLLTSQQTTFPNNQVSKTTWSYDSNEMQTEQDDYDFGSGAAGALLRATVTNYATFGSNHIVEKPSSVIVYSDAAHNNKVAETDYTYDNPAGTVTSGIVQHVSGCNCGSLTKTAQWLNTSGTTLNTTYTNDDTGQRLSMTDPRGNQTTYSYADNYSSGTPPGPTNAYLTQVTHPQTNGVNHIEKFSYAYSSGEVTSSTDQNNLVTNYKYLDNLARLTETDFPDGGKTTIAYNDAAYNPSTPSPSVTTTKMINGSTSAVTVAAVDGLGHPVTGLVTSDPQGTIHTDTTYDGVGRVYTVSNPYRTGSDPTTSSGTTTYGYDALGRKTSETYPDNSVLTTAYCAGSTLVTDPTGRWRRSRLDGLGRLVEVDEPNAPGASVNSNGCPGTGEPIWVTSYTLDTLGNLKTVVQYGSRQRNFTYDWTSRLLTAQNPETGTITYNYDSDSNCSSPNSFSGLLVSKVDARGIRTCAQYDALNRGTVLNYSNGDPTITTTYDQTACLGLSSCQNIGHETSRTDAAGSESWAYQVDATNVRSVHVNQRTTNSITKTSTYYFDLAGNLYQVVYPTGRTVNYTYDAANRPKTAADGSNGITYATDFQTAPTGCLTGAVCYTPQGTFYALSIGQSSGFTGLNLTHTYNNRLQPNEFKASSTGGNAVDITYNFVDSVSGHNAGHVYGITNNLDATRSQTFSYDQLNRLTGALTTSTHATSPTHCWGETYTVDAWGNLNSIAATTNSNYTGCSEESGFSSAADANNHLPAWSYDASGNATSDGVVTNYQWDAESQLKSAAGVNYTYDGDGRRVAKVGSKLYWYGSGGDILAETDPSGNTTAEYIFFGGKRIAMLPASGNAQYYVEDLLGTSRILTTNTGAVCYDADFYPYGGERSYTNTCPQNYKFEGKERDTETGNDDFGARYYSNRFGRWLSADWSSVPAPVPYANLTNPQSLNLYSMVADDPESFADLDGHDPNGNNNPPSQGGTPCTQQSSYGSCSEQLKEEARTAEANAANDQKPQAQEQSIAQTAQNKVGSTDYEQAKSKDNYKAGTNKCNQLCADVVQESGASRPKVPRSGILGWLGFTRDPTAHELADPNVHIAGWSSPMAVSSAKPGDIIAQAHGAYGHSGVVVLWNGKLQTVSVNSTTNPAGIVTRNDWGFRPRGGNGEGPNDPAPVVRRYVGGDQ